MPETSLPFVEIVRLLDSGSFAMIYTIVALTAAGFGLGLSHGHAAASESATPPSLVHPLDLIHAVPTSERAVSASAALQAATAAPAASSPQAPASAATPSIFLLPATRERGAASVPMSRPVKSPERESIRPTQSSLDAYADLGIFGRLMCVLSQCRQDEMQKQPQCVEPCRTEEERQRRMQQ